jgi:hypothetical protein
LGPEARPGSGNGKRQWVAPGASPPPDCQWGPVARGVRPPRAPYPSSHRRLLHAAALCPAVTGGPGAPSSNSLVPDASLTQPGHELDRQHDVARRERDWQHPLRSCQSLRTESTLRPPTCGHRPFPSRAASCGHGLPSCGWPASLQSPATPEEVDGIRRLGGQQESVRHERDNDNCELKVTQLYHEAGARCVQRRASSLSGPRSSWGLCRGS